MKYNYNYKNIFYISILITKNNQIETMKFFTIFFYDIINISTVYKIFLCLSLNGMLLSKTEIISPKKCTSYAWT